MCRMIRVVAIGVCVFEDLSVLFAQVLVVLSMLALVLTLVLALMLAVVGMFLVEIDVSIFIE